MSVSEDCGESLISGVYGDDGEDDLFESFDQGDCFEEENPMSKRRSSKPIKKRRSSFGIARAAINTAKTKKRMVAAIAAKPALGSPLAKKKLTTPITPNLLLSKRMMGSKSLKNSEQLLIEKIGREKAEEMRRINRAKKMYSKLKANGFHQTSSASHAALPAKKLTIPQGPKSLLDIRLGVRPTSAPVKEVAVPKKSQGKIGQHTVTIPQPFNFSSTKRASTEIVADHLPKDNVKSAAEMAELFMKETRSYKPSTSTSSAPASVTIPQGPKLQTAIRAHQKSGPDGVSALESTEDQIIAEQQKHAFKARPLDRRIFESRGEIGVPKVAPKQLTVPVDFVFRTDTRLKERHSSAHLQSVSASASELSSAPTQQSSVSSASVAKPISTAASQRKSVTQPVEFHLSTAVRGERHRAELQEKLKREEDTAREQAHAAVKAHPAPDFSHIRRASYVSPREATVPEPFSLHSTALHEESQAQFQKDVEDMRRIERMSMIDFKAGTVPRTNSAGFEPKVHAVEHKPVTVPQSIKLESEMRAKRRSEFDLLMQKRMEENAKLQSQCEKRNEDIENQQLQSMRRKSVDEGGLMFKAKPIVTKDLYPVNKSSSLQKFEPTIPRSPKFLLKERKGSKLNTQMDSDVMPMKLV